MATAFVPGLRCERNSKIKKTRELPIAGELLVSLGSKVKSSDSVAKALLPGDLHILRIPEKMGLEVHEILAGLHAKGIKIDTSIQKGSVLCEHRGLFGLFSSRFESPVTGAIEFVSEKIGHVGVREPPKSIVLDAYVSGVVTATVPNRSVTIESIGGYVQGIFGVGGERKGKLMVLDVKPNETVTESHIPDNIAGSIIVGGTSPNIAALRKASKAGAVGFITGAIDDKALAAFLGYDLGVALTGDEDISMTVIITEGFGSLGISERVYSLLKEFDGYEASINGATQVRAGAVRPEIIISHDKSGGTSAQHSYGLSIGQLVRIIRVPYFGIQAKIVDLPNDLEKIETGAVTRVLRVALPNNEIVTVPRANVEII